jgi:hypothetical protein
MFDIQCKNVLGSRPAATNCSPLWCMTDCAHYLYVQYRFSYSSTERQRRMLPKVEYDPTSNISNIETTQGRIYTHDTPWVKF